MPSATDIYGDCAKSGSKIERKKYILCAHFIEHIEGIVHGSGYASTRSWWIGGAWMRCRLMKISSIRTDH
jgi:hypothetical protein